MIAQGILERVTGSRTTRALDALVQAYAKQGRFSGAALVAREGNILLSKGYGYAEQDQTWDKNMPKTTFRIGSMSKPFTAIAVMQLVEAGHLSLSDPLSRFIPGYPQGERITIRHLLSNRSGIEDFISMPEYERLQTRRVSMGDLIALFRDRPLRFEPGTDYGYNNSNWVLLAAIVEQIIGQPSARIIRERVLSPVGMDDSGLDWSAPVKRRSVGYIDTGAGIQAVAVLDSSTMRGGGDIHSTLEDLHRFARALNTDILLPQAALRQMWTPFTEIDAGGYGLGFEVHTHHGRRAIGHSGGMPGYVSNFTHFIDEDITIIILSNLGSAAWELITDGLAAILFGAAYTLPTERQFVPVDPVLLEDYAGAYELQYFGRTAILRFSVEGGALVMDTQGLPKAILSPLSETTFFGRSKGEVEFTFVREPAGAINRIETLWAGYKLVANRIG